MKSLFKNFGLIFLTLIIFEIVSIEPSEHRLGLKVEGVKGKAKRKEGKKDEASEEKTEEVKEEKTEEVKAE